MNKDQGVETICERFDEAQTEALRGNLQSTLPRLSRMQCAESGAAEQGDMMHFFLI